MSYDARHIANWFIERAGADGRVLSVMHLLKLTYITHGWHLAAYNKPLYSNRTEAWRFGPVIPDMYHDFKDQGLEVKIPVAMKPVSPISKTVKDLLKKVYDSYSLLSTEQLIDKTHVAGGPWDIAMKSGGRYTLIPDESTKRHYDMKILETKIDDSSNSAV